MMMRCRIWILTLILSGATAATLFGQEKPAPPTAQQAPATAPASPQAPVANPADVASPDAILAALYNVISGPVTQKRDWDRFRSLFLPGARLIPTGKKPGGSSAGARVLTPDEYVTLAGPFLEKEGFFEKEVARRPERWGNILQAFSTYESRHAQDDPKPFARGINSIQLFFDGTRWWVVTIFWQQETPDLSLSKEYLPTAP